jgi:hypothetical protein
MLDAMDAVTAIQRRQLGLITVDQAVTAGLTYEQIRGLCQRGVWFAEREGVFAPAGAPPTAERAVLAERLPGYDPGDSDLETRVLKTIVGAGLPPPIQQHRVRVRRKTYKLDLAYPHLLAGFELDSWKYHGQHSPFTDDRTRRNYLELVGWRIYQFTDSHSDAHILDVVRSVLGAFARSPAA